MLRSVIAVLLVAACGPTPPFSPAPSAEGQPDSAGAVVDGLIVTLDVESSRPPSGRSSRAAVTVRNTSQEVRLWQGGGCDFVAVITIDTAAATEPARGRDWPGMAGLFKSLLRPNPGVSKVGAYLDERTVAGTLTICPASLGVNQLAPGATLTMRAIWDGQVNGVAAAPGAATVAAVFPYLGPDAGSGPNIDPSDLGHAIRVAVPVVVTPPDRPLLSPGEAIDAALADPAFSSFLMAAGPMAAWEGVDLESPEGAYVVILYVNHQAGRATVDRRTGSVSFEVRPRA
jgi:hypothetical protein